MNWTEFDIHGRVAMRVRKDAPTEPMLRTLLEPFVTSGLDKHHITVIGDEPAPMSTSGAECGYRYDDSAVVLDHGRVEIVFEDDALRVSGRGELLSAILPLIDRLMVGRGAAMVHCGMAQVGGIGLLLPAWGGAGKTSTLAKLVRAGADFMGDDWGFVSDDGALLGYAKPIFIKAHHRPIFPHLFEGARKPLAPKALVGPLNRAATAVHPIVTRYPRVAAVTRKWSPEHRITPVSRAFPDAVIATKAPLGAVVFLERWDGAEVSLQERDRSWMVARLIGNFHAELPPHSRDVIDALGATGLVPLERVFSEKAEVLHAGIGARPTLLLRVPQSFSADRASDVVVAHLLELAGASSTRAA